MDHESIRSLSYPSGARVALVRELNRLMEVKQERLDRKQIMDHPNKRDWQQSGMTSPQEKWLLNEPDD
ncbi:MAG: hypothetical protein JWO91_3937 [Acidobacteriaceae bacterium]|jgi:hypothetical protein|nr:hypothetical protein [Acidobacteriaceae bacterium]